MRIPLIALSGLLGASAALAQTSSSSDGSGAPGASERSPWVFGIQQGYIREDNLFRSAPGAEVSDSIWASGLRLGVDQEFGRQRFTADAVAHVNRYRKNEQLNNTDYQVGARLDWQTVERVSGDISVRQRKGLYRESVNGIVSTERNELRESSAAFQARVGLVTRWSFEAGVAASENKYRGASVVNRDLRQNAANAGIRYQSSPAFGVRLGARHSDGKYPNYASTGLGTGPDEFKRDDIDLVTTFTPSGASHLDARISATREEHTQQSQRDSDGWTGAIGWRWRPTGKLNFNLDLSRDTSIGRSGFGTALIGAEASDASLTQVAALEIEWAATSKIQVVPRASYAYRKLDAGFITGTGTTTGNDKTTLVGIGLRYQPISALDLGCDYSREKRKSEGGLSAPYTASIVNCSAEFAFR